MRDALREALPDATVISIPMADGGEGTTVTAVNGYPIKLKVKNAVGNPIKAVYGMTGDGRTAFMDMAASFSVLNIIYLLPNHVLYLIALASGLDDSVSTQFKFN